MCARPQPLLGTHYCGGIYGRHGSFSLPPSALSLVECGLHLMTEEENVGKGRRRPQQTAPTPHDEGLGHGDTV